MRQTICWRPCSASTTKDSEKGEKAAVKAFFTGVPLQGRGMLKRYRYLPVGNEKLAMEEGTSFPILTAVNGYVEPGETFRVVAVCPDSEDGRRNLGRLEEELDALCAGKGCVCAQLEVVPAQKSERVTDQVAVFQRLIELVEENDELFACLTFGTKPQSQVLLMAMQYAYRIKRNTSISCILYGQVDRSTGQDPESWGACVYDETALLQLDEVVRILAERKISNPKAVIDGILNL